ncbi:hypothetical protein Bhyg_04046 [Pseudolycoriella hygida]|uniref:Uncharacterized protein n=1 Tax=Pseudolycoriella hygida TaxID=35572 RepID=A0A9Q0NFX9_9DIPT|nr:hypothetical protein Bhyg_04046 [Pseudolycoriella hygida]
MCNNPCPNIKRNVATVALKMKQNTKRKYLKRKKQKSQQTINAIREMSNTNTINRSVDNARNAAQNQTAVAQMWKKTYESMIRLQYEHRIQYWKNLAINRNTEIHELKKKLQNYCNQSDKLNTHGDKSKSSSNHSSQGDLTSESYLDFLEITLRHRKELKRKNLETEDSD